MKAPRDPFAAPTPHGFTYFCEEQLQYRRGFRAWLFWAPYLIGAILLEPKNLGAGLDLWRAWLPLLGFLILFPPLWRALLRRLGLWRRRNAAAG